MKTFSKIFAVLFTILCLVATGAVICGKTHQWVMAVASGVMAVAYWFEVCQQVTEEYEQSARRLREFAELIAPLYPEGKMFVFWEGVIIIPAQPKEETSDSNLNNKQ